MNARGLRETRSSQPQRPLDWALRTQEEDEPGHKGAGVATPDASAGTCADAALIVHPLVASTTSRMIIRPCSGVGMCRRRRRRRRPRSRRPRRRQLGGVHFQRRGAVRWPRAQWGRPRCAPSLLVFWVPCSEPKRRCPGRPPSSQPLRSVGEDLHTRGRVHLQHLLEHRRMPTRRQSRTTAHGHFRTSRSRTNVAPRGGDLGVRPCKGHTNQALGVHV